MKMSLYKIVLILVGAVGSLLVFWMVVLRLISKLGIRGPCPASFAWLVDNPVRHLYTRQVLDRIGVRPGERVLELGPGPGAFTLDAARRTGPQGEIIAVDIQPKMIHRLERKIREAGVTNIKTHIADAYCLPLDDMSVDRIFLVTVLPEIPDKGKALQEMWRVLRPGGILSISEEFLDPDYPLVSTTLGWVVPVGFDLAERHGNWWFYTLNFRKKEQAD
jgi:SAM-dependent methyltransferase